MSTFSMSNNHRLTTINAHSSSSSSPSSTTHACAACKYQRRKCQPHCVLAPYFPHHHQRQFHNAHKLFGVSNITKIIRNLSPSQKDEAMRTIIFQSDARATDPVLGCYRIVCDLQRQIEYCQAELDIVLRQLEICRAQEDVAAVGRIHPFIGGCEVVDDGEFMEPHYDFTTDDEGHEEVVAAITLNDFNVAWAMQDPTLLMMPFDVVDKKHGYVNGCEDMKRLLDIADDREDLKLEFDSIVHKRSKIECLCPDHRHHQPTLTHRFNHKEEISIEHQDSSHVRSEDESPCLQFVQDDDLKGATTLFTLTNCSN